jgi:hypothetical protein
MRMRPAEVIALRAQIADSDDELADELGVPVTTLRAWTAGERRIPRYEAQLLRFAAASAERGRALVESGLPECEWIRAWGSEEHGSDDDALMASIDRMEAHSAACATCQARERFVDARFGPMPPFPARGLARVFVFMERVPEFLRPAAYGAALLAAIVSLRALVVIPSLIARPALVLDLLVAILAAAGAGASGGLVFSMVRPTLRTLGRPGDYLTGIVCVGAYMASLVLVAPVAFGEDLLKGRSGWFAYGIVTILMGLVIGHSWFKAEPEKAGV